MIHHPTYTFQEINNMMADAMNNLKGILELVLATKPHKPVNFTPPYIEADFYYTLHFDLDYVVIRKFQQETDVPLAKEVKIDAMFNDDAITDTLFHIQKDIILSLIRVDVEQLVSRGNFIKC